MASNLVKSLIPVLFVILCFSVGYAQDLPPRTQVTHYLGDYEGVEPPLMDGILDDAAWIHSAQGPGPGSSLNNWHIMYHHDLDTSEAAQPGVVEGDELPVDSNDLSYRVWTVYDDEYLYVAVEVIDYEMVIKLPEGDEDGATWNEDSVEIFIDGNHNAVPGNVNDHPEEYETGGQFVMTSGGARRDKEAGDPSFGEGPDDEWYASVFDNSDFTGFNYEFRIKLSKIGDPQKGDTIGFNVAVNDADDSSADGSDFQFRWVGQAHDESTYGDLYFGRREVTAPQITEAITIDGEMNESSWASAGSGRGNPFEGPSQPALYPADYDDLAFEFYVLHDNDFLYVAVDVTDNIVKTDTEPSGSVDGNTWHDDSAEVFLDGDYSRNDGVNAGLGLGGQLVMTANTAQRGQGGLLFGEEDDWFADASLTDTGYLIEFRFDKEAMFTPIDTDIIGFNIAINEDDNDETEDDRDYQLMWNGPAHRESCYGALLMGGPPVSVDLWDIY